MECISMFRTLSLPPSSWTNMVDDAAVYCVLHRSNQRWYRQRQSLKSHTTSEILWTLFWHNWLQNLQIIFNYSSFIHEISLIKKMKSRVCKYGGAIRAYNTLSVWSSYVTPEACHRNTRNQTKPILLHSALETPTVHSNLLSTHTCIVAQK
jgi:hypothetical protein